MTQLMRLIPIPFVGIFVKGDTCVSGAQNSRTDVGDYSSLIFDRDHWILCGRFNNNEFYMDSSLFGQVSQVCGLYCVLFLSSLVFDGQRRAEMLYSQLLPKSNTSPSVDPRRLAAREIHLIETLQQALLDDDDD